MSNSLKITSDYSEVSEASKNPRIVSGWSGLKSIYEGKSRDLSWQAVLIECSCLLDNIILG